jgi:hypothetical protein
MLKKILALLRDESFKKRIVQGAAQRLDEKFDTRTMVKTHEDLYQELADVKGVAHAY